VWWAFVTILYLENDALIDFSGTQDHWWWASVTKLYLVVNWKYIPKQFFIKLERSHEL
jgi:hypothetical protein